MDDALLTAAICNSRVAYERAKVVGLRAQDFSDAARVIVQAAMGQYARDTQIQAADRSLIAAAVNRECSQSDAGPIIEFLQDLPTDTSAVNVLDEYRQLRLRQTATLVAGRLAAGMLDAETDGLIETYQKLQVEVDDDTKSWRLDLEDFKDTGFRVPLAPRRLSDWLDGGMPRGSNVTVYGRPNSAKTLFALNAAAVMCKVGKKVLYICNEEHQRVLTKRVIARMSQTPIRQLDDPWELERALESVSDAYSNWHLLHEGGLTIQKIGLQAAAIKPDFIVIDQLHNLSVKGDNRALQLDALARGVRELGIEHDAITLSVTQAGASAHNKRRLEMNDVDWSNTGIPAAADLMLGIGVDFELLGSNERIISIAKNKINGKHGAFKVKIDPQTTRIYTPKRRDV